MKRKTQIFLALLVTFVLLTTPPALMAARLNLKLAHNLPPTDTSLYHQAALKFKELVEKESGGDIRVQIFPAAQLGSDVSVAKKVQSGAIEMEIITANKLGAFYPAIDLYSLPFLMNDLDVSERVFQTQVHKTVVRELEQMGIRLLATPQPQIVNALGAAIMGEES